MVNRQKWADFTLIGTTTRADKQTAQGQREYTAFACPYGCGVAVELPSANVKNNKSSECATHLLACKGVAHDGRRAQDDPRLLNTAAYKKKRALDGASVAQTTAPASTELATRCTELEQQNTALTSEKGSLQSQVNGLIEQGRRHEADMVELREAVAKLTHEKTELSAQVGSLTKQVSSLTVTTQRLKVWQKEVACAIGVKLSPIPSSDECVRRIRKLKQPSSLFGHHAEMEELRTENAHLNKRDRSFRKLVGHERFYKSIQVALHPDKRGQFPENLRPHAEALYAQMLEARRHV